MWLNLTWVPHVASSQKVTETMNLVLAFARGDCERRWFDPRLPGQQGTEQFAFLERCSTPCGRFLLLIIWNNFGGTLFGYTLLFSIDLSFKMRNPNWEQHNNYRLVIVLRIHPSSLSSQSFFPYRRVALSSSAKMVFDLCSVKCARINKHQGTTCTMKGSTQKSSMMIVWILKNFHSGNIFIHRIGWKRYSTNPVF